MKMNHRKANTLDGKMVDAVHVGEGNVARIVGASLKALRELSGISQSELANRLSVARATIYRIEQKADVKLSTLQNYVEALGARLRIDAALSPEHFNFTDHLPAFETNNVDENQLVFPLFADEPTQKSRDVILSIRPFYSDKILAGKKTVELRRRFPVTAPKGATAYIYSTSPVRAIVACANIKEIYKLPIDEIWKNFRKSASIRKEDFNSYFSGLESGYAIQFSDIRPLARPLPLEELRERFSFAPPQSFLYATPTMRKAIRHECAKLPH